ncbi:MAG: B12-binding domain-containing radical SAM protein, partial [Planctomycetota bacterium]
MRVLLVSPRSVFPDVTPGWLRIPQMSLAILEALTPPQHDVRIVEEEVEQIPDGEWDLVGISVMTATAPRAYELARRFRARGAKVVLGGVHATVLPDEGLRYADAVVVGEAEGVWQKVVDDCRRGRLERVYVNIAPEISRVPLVRYRMGGRMFAPRVAPVVASRGCPNNCEFCCVHRVYGRRVRRLPVERVVAQVEASGAKHIIFLDDNLGVSRRYAFELFRRLRQLRVRWSAQVSVRFILDDELFRAAVRSGLVGLFVGVESVDPVALRRLKKSVPLEGYVKAIRRCRNHGVIFHASLIFGLDDDKKDVFRKTLDFVMRHRLPSVSANVLTPYPGTALFDRLMRQRRIVHKNWAYYDHTTPVYRPAGMSMEELAEGYLWFRKNLFSIGGILRRLPAQMRVNPVIYLGMNAAYHRTTRLMQEHYRRYFAWLARHQRSGA